MYHAFRGIANAFHDSELPRRLPRSKMKKTAQDSATSSVTTVTESGVIPILVTVVTLLVALSCAVFFIFDRGRRRKGTES